MKYVCRLCGSWNMIIHVSFRHFVHTKSCRRRFVRRSTANKHPCAHACAPHVFTVGSVLSAAGLVSAANIFSQHFRSSRLKRTNDMKAILQICIPTHRRLLKMVRFVSLRLAATGCGFVIFGICVDGAKGANSHIHISLFRIRQINHFHELWLCGFLDDNLAISEHELDTLVAIVCAFGVIFHWCNDGNRQQCCVAVPSVRLCSLLPGTEFPKPSVEWRKTWALVRAHGLWFVLRNFFFQRCANRFYGKNKQLFRRIRRWTTDEQRIATRMNRRTC